MLSWYGHVERMKNRKLPQQFYKACVNWQVNKGRRIYHYQIEDVLGISRLRMHLTDEGVWRQGCVFVKRKMCVKIITSGKLLSLPWWEITWKVCMYCHRLWAWSVFGDLASYSPNGDCGRVVFYRFFLRLLKVEVFNNNGTISIIDELS